MEGKGKGKRIRQVIFANWGLKLISILAAFILWLCVVYFNDPLVTVTFNNVEVQLVNTDLLTDQGMVYEVLDDSDVIRRVTVRGSSSVLAQMQEAGDKAIVATADVADKNMYDEIPIELTALTNYGSAITEMSISSGSNTVKLLVEDEKTKSVSLMVALQGEPAEGYEVGSYKAEINRISVTGGESKVNQVSFAVVNVDVSGVSSDITATGVIDLYDANGDLLDSDLAVEKNNNVTRVTVDILSTKEIPVIFTTIGEVAEGCEITDISGSPDTVTIAGTESALNGVSAVYVDDLDISGLSGSIGFTVDLEDYLPDNISVSSSEETGTAFVSVSVESIEDMTFEISADNIQLLNVPEGAKVEFADESYFISVRGLESVIGSTGAESFGISVDVGTWMTNNGYTQLPEGTYSISARVFPPDGVEVISGLSVSLIFGDQEEEVE